MMNVVGWDLSLTSTGYACRNREGEPATGRIKTKVKGVPRLSELRYQLRDLLTWLDTKENPLTLAVIEGYAMGYGGAKKNPGRTFNIGEWGGIVRLEIFDMSVPMLIVPPPTLKVFATGHGDADKPQVIQSIAEVWGLDIPNDDEADAFALMMLGEAYQSLRRRRRYGQNRLRALDGVEYIPVDS